MVKLICTLALLCVLGSAFGLELSDNLVPHLWNTFKKAHDKLYEADELEAYRFGVFRANLRTVEQHNAEYAAGLHTYRLALNQFADWTPREFARKMLATHVNGTRDTRANSVTTFVRLAANVHVPDSVDWRAEGAVTPVKNQGECGSCWAFSSTGSLEGAHYRLTGQLVSLSEQQLVDCSGSFQNNGCDGGLMNNAFNYVKSAGGLDTEESYPYHAKQEKCHFNKKTIGTICSGFVDVDSGDEQALKEALATQGPVSVAIDVTEGKFMLYKDGVFVDNTCKNDDNSLNHGVLVVGYGSNVTSEHYRRTLSDETLDFWTIKNSWGPTWGESGYIRMARNLNNMCGVATKASYPLVKDVSRNNF